ncbi:MAG: S8 family peptidase, partial [Bacteroidota bacterium]|nr:S8 family peptidase [Bacteroidota bacterium]
VVNNSWGGTNRSQVGQDIVDYANSRNCVVVAASGNSGTFDNLYPASYDHVLSVAAVDEGGNVTSFSNFNAHVDVSAPGSNIESTVPDAMYATMTGTSMASPNASGAIAMVRQKFPNFTADQAIQRLRTTTSPRSSTQDIHPGYTGTGLIDLKQAVSDAPSYSARLESVEILDENHNGILESGEGADIVLHVRNYLNPVTDLQAKIEYIDDTFGAISANTETVRFGKANTLELVQNFQGSFHISLAKNTPADYTVSVRITFSSSPQGYGPDLDYFSLSINQAYLSLDQNNLTVTFNSKGGLGYNDPPGNTQGMGFVWTKPPSSIVLEGRDILSQAGLMIGVDDSARIVSAAPGEYGDGYTMQDFSFTKAIHYVTPPDHTNAVQELQTTYADVNADPSLQVGVSVDEQSYAFTNDLAANAVVIDYVVRKRVVDSVSYLTDSTAMALFMDWDIGASGSINKAYVSALDSAIGITRRMEDAYPFVGIKLLSDIPAGSSINFYALDNDGSNGSVNKYDGLDRSEKWRTMTTPRPVAGIGDVSMIYGLKNLPLRSQDSIRLTFVIALAENEQILKQTIDATEHEWQLHSGVPMTEHSSNLPLEISPNPFSGRLHVAWNSADPSAQAELSISDAIGRVIETRSIRGSSLEITGLVVPPGTYFISVHQGNTYCRGTIVSMP